MPALLLDGARQARGNSGRCSAFSVRFAWLAYLDDAGRYTSDDGKVRNVADYNSVGADDDVIADAYAAQDFGPCPEMHPVADYRSAERILRAGVTECYAVTDQTIITHDSGAMNDDAAVMFDAQTAAYPGATAYTYSTEDLGELVQHDVDDRPRQADVLVTNHEARVTEAVHEQRPVAYAEQAFALRLQVFDYPHHEVRPTMTFLSGCGNNHMLASWPQAQQPPVDNNVK
jgi:hypothetical protein